MRWTPRGFGGERRSADKVKHEGWHEQNILVVSLDDHRLSGPESELITQLGTKLYGKRKPKEESNA